MTTITRRQQHSTITTYSYVIAFIQIALVVVAGSICGFVVAALHALSVSNGDVGLQDFTSFSEPPRSLSSSDNNSNNNNNSNNCRLPPKSTRLTIPTNNDGTFIDLVVWDDGDFLTEAIQKTGVWEILNIQGMAELGETTMPQANNNNNGTTDLVFWDIGANVGYYSFLFAAAGYTVVAVEPEHHNAELFQASLCLNPLLASRITLLPNVALSSPEHNGSHQCHLYGRAVAKRMKQYLHLIPRLVCDTAAATTTTTAKKSCPPGTSSSSTTICQDQITVTTLDALSKSYPAPHVLKVDVEGHELAVFKGGPQLLSNPSNNNNDKKATTTTTTTTTAAAPPPSIIQYGNKDGRTEKEIAALLESYGYTISSLRGHDMNTVASKKQVDTTTTSPSS